MGMVMARGLSQFLKGHVPSVLATRNRGGGLSSPACRHQVGRSSEAAKETTRNPGRRLREAGRSAADDLSGMSCGNNVVMREQPHGALTQSGAT